MLGAVNAVAIDSFQRGNDPEQLRLALRRAIDVALPPEQRRNTGEGRADDSRATA